MCYTIFKAPKGCTVFSQIGVKETSREVSQASLAGIGTISPAFCAHRRFDRARRSLNLNEKVTELLIEGFLHIISQ